MQAANPSLNDGASIALATCTPLSEDRPMRLNSSLVVFLALASLTTPVYAQQPVGQDAQDRAEREARRFGVGVVGGVGLDPEIIAVGAHATFGPVFKPDLLFRPGVEIGAGEVTTTLAINLDFLYSFRGDRDQPRWTPYVGTGPTFGLSHRGFSTDDTDHVDTDDEDTTANRFDFSDTDFNGGMNFIVGMRKAGGAFFEMRATAWGVSNIRLLAGFTF
jgi:hypothetical protein